MIPERCEPAEQDDAFVTLVRARARARQGGVVGVAA